jgi:hypothetical protein
MVRIALLSFFFLSVVILPWYVSVMLGIVLLVRWDAYLSVLLGGIVLDSTFGAPLYVAGGFEWLYFAFFSVCAFLVFILKRRTLE